MVPPVGPRSKVKVPSASPAITIQLLKARIPSFKASDFRIRASKVHVEEPEVPNGTVSIRSVERYLCTFGNSFQSAIVDYQKLSLTSIN
jgi:hypothetical protein